MDHSAYQEFGRLQTENPDIDLFKLPMLESGEVDMRKIEAESYALNAYLIQMQWNRVKNIEPFSISKEKIGENYLFWIIFKQMYLLFFKTVGEELRIKMKESVEKFIEHNNVHILTKEEKVLCRAFLIFNLDKKTDGGIHVPIFSDLILFYTNFSEVAFSLFEKDKKRPPSQEEFLHILKHKSFLNRFIQFMHNNKMHSIPASYFLFDDEDKVAEIGEPQAEDFFNMKHFFIEYENDLPILKMKESTIKEMHDVVAYYAEEDKDARVLCNFLYIFY